MLSSLGTLPEGVTSYAVHTWPWPVHTPARPRLLAPPCTGPRARLDHLFFKKPALTSPWVLQMLLICQNSLCTLVKKQQCGNPLSIYVYFKHFFVGIF